MHANRNLPDELHDGQMFGSVRFRRVVEVVEVGQLAKVRTSHKLGDAIS